LALTSPTNGGRSVGIVRWRTKAPEFLFLEVESNFQLHVCDSVYLNAFNIRSLQMWISQRDYSKRIPSSSSINIAFVLYRPTDNEMSSLFHFLFSFDFSGAISSFPDVQ
jgi:hypothetical protein